MYISTFLFFKPNQTKPNQCSSNFNFFSVAPSCSCPTSLSGAGRCRAWLWRWSLPEVESEKWFKINGFFPPHTSLSLLVTKLILSKSDIFSAYMWKWPFLTNIFSLIFLGARKVACYFHCKRFNMGFEWLLSWNYKEPDVFKDILQYGIFHDDGDTEVGESLLLLLVQSARACWLFSLYEQEQKGLQPQWCPRHGKGSIFGASLWALEVSNGNHST